MTDTENKVASQTQRSIRGRSEILTDAFTEFVQLEEASKRINENKALIYKKAAALGFDGKALRVAFHRRMREMERADAIEFHDAHDALVVEYLTQLRNWKISGASRPASEPLSGTETRSEEQPSKSEQNPPKRDTRSKRSGHTGPKRRDVANMPPAPDQRPSISAPDTFVVPPLPRGEVEARMAFMRAELDEAPGESGQPVLDQ